MAATSLSYACSGVDIEAGNNLVNDIKPLAKSTNRAGVVGGLGGFGGIFDLKAAGFKDPLLIAANDGVGTKLKLGIETGILEGLGIDLVAMCVNDLVVQGAEPLFFLDYFATSALDAAQARPVIAGIAEGCKQAGCALLGGETAEMPGMYMQGDFDLAGFAVGGVEREALITGSTVQAGNMLLGLPSNGVHSNGFSLVRKILERSGLSLNDAAPYDTSKTLGESLLTPTTIYVKECLSAIKTGGVTGLAHITGGGLVENLPRVLPNGVVANITGNWAVPAVFDWLQGVGNVAIAEMRKVFNLGIGMVLVVDAGSAAAIQETLPQAVVMGELVAGEAGAAPSVVYTND